MPLLLETLLLCTLSYFLGIGIAWLIYGRRRRTSFLGDER